MITTYLEDQTSAVAVLLNDANDAPYYPAPTVGAAKVVLLARDKDKDVDTAMPVAEGKPGGNFSIPYAALQGRDMLFGTVSYSSNNTPSVSNLEHVDWHELPVAAGTIEVSEVMVDTAVIVGGDQVIGPREAAVSHVTAGTGSTVLGTAGGTYDPTVQTIINDLVAQVNTLKAAVDATKSTTNTALTRLETHGLIAP